MELSSTTQTNINLPFISAGAAGPLHLDYTLSRAEFERITRICSTAARSLLSRLCATLVFPRAMLTR